MKLIFRWVGLVSLTLLSKGMAIAQIPVELFSGDKKATIDVMFFKFIKNREGQNSRFLFFNRNRASIDYAMTETTDLPQFGFTEAISFNHKKLKGLAPVIVGSVLNRGVYPKVGIQYAIIKKDYTLFSWAVVETLREPKLDVFFLGRYTPKLSEKLHLFSQIELVNVFPTEGQTHFSFTQRFRLGIKIKELQLGAGWDLSHLGRNEFTLIGNLGVFLRYEF